jgi:hypothetical protein
VYSELLIPPQFLPQPPDVYLEGRSRHAAVEIAPDDLEEHLPRQDLPKFRFNSSKRPDSFLSDGTRFDKRRPLTLLGRLFEDRHYDRPSQFDFLIHPQLAHWHAAKHSEKQVRL